MTLDFSTLRSLTDIQAHRREMAGEVSAENARRAQMMLHPSNVTRLHGSVGAFDDSLADAQVEIVRLRQSLADDPNAPVIDLDSKRGGRA